MTPDDRDGEEAGRRRCPTRIRGTAGFTLVEALLSGMILALSAVAIGVGLGQSMRAMERSRDMQRAAELLDDAMTRVDLIGPDRLQIEGPLSGRFDPPDERFAWQTDIEPLIDGYLYEITIRVTWRDASGQHSADLSTRLNDPPGSRGSTLQWGDL